VESLAVIDNDKPPLFREGTKELGRIRDSRIDVGSEVRSWTFRLRIRRGSIAL